MELRKVTEPLTEGKTKIIWPVEGDDALVIIEQKTDITAMDDPSLTQRFDTKARHANVTTCRVFDLLAKADIPLAYREQVSETEFLAEKCEMIPLEVVARRYAVGSYLKRYPHLAVPEGDPPYRFHSLVAEFFLKTTGGKLEYKGEMIVEDLDPKAGEEDPFIKDPYADVWDLFHPKKPGWAEDADLECRLFGDVVDGLKANVSEMELILRKVFLTLEGAWSTLGLRLIDMKIEFGITTDGRLVVADVIDNDSWRLRNSEWEELSKETFRQGAGLDEVERKYAIVASLVEQFRVPKQGLIVWRGSESDDYPLSPEEVSDWLEMGVVVEPVVMSGHKSTRMSLDKLEEVLTKYPDGGVIIAKVGRSNGLGPVLAAHTSWQVIAIPATMKSFPGDVHSSTRMPSKVPMATVWPDSNAILAAKNILGIKNPILYMDRQLAIEAMDI